MSNVRFDELELMLMAMFEQPTLKDTIQVLMEVQPLVAEDAEMSALVQQTILKMQRLTEPQFKGLELEWYKPEEPEKILVASASIHGHTRAAAHTMAEKLRAKGAKVVEMDLTRTDVSYAVTEAFRCGKIVLACATYDGFLFPPMESLLTHLKTKAFQNRTVGLMENGTWAPMAAKLMRAELEGMKNIMVCENVVTIRSAANAAAEAQMDALADEIVAK